MNRGWYLSSYPEYLIGVIFMSPWDQRGSKFIPPVAWPRPRVCTYPLFQTSLVGNHVETRVSLFISPLLIAVDNRTGMNVAAAPFFIQPPARCLLMLKICGH